ncbi:large ribosomal subunit protein mL64 [Aulostomus maculatus]
MAALMLCKRTMIFCRFLQGVSFSKSKISAISSNGLLLQIASYNPKPLKLNIREPYIPDKDSEKTPEWQTTAKYARKLFGRYGSVSGIDPATLWPSHEELDKIIAEEHEWQPPLEVLLKNVAAKENEKMEKRLAREKLIAEKMAQMPKMIADWRKEKRLTKQKAKEEHARREQLLAMAKERLGYAIDYRSPKFKEMVAELEKEEKKKRKEAKRKLQLGMVPALETPPVDAS